MAAVNDRYKLVLDKNENPWPFDLKEDPDELVNFYLNPKYKNIAESLKKELIKQMKLYKEPGFEMNLSYKY